jgi:hypothetical protein
VIVTVLPSASVPAVITVQLSVRLMIHVPALVCSLICVAVNPITVPVALSVLFPEGGGIGVGRGLGVGVGRVAIVLAGALVFFSSTQLARSVVPARMQIKVFAFIG